MYPKNNLNSQKPQGTNFSTADSDLQVVYLAPSAKLYKPLLGITRINDRFVTLAFIEAWGLLPPPYDVKKSKSENDKVIMNLRKDFYKFARHSGVEIGQKANVKQLLFNIQHFGKMSFPEYEKTTALLTAIYYLQFVEGAK